MSRTKSRQVVIVGAGIFGSVAADLCFRNGFDVTIIDAKYKEAGSKPAACLIAPSWIAGLGKKATIGMEVLNGLYPIKDIVFRMNGIKDILVKQVPPNKILKFKSVKEEVMWVGAGVVETTKRMYTGKVLIAAGVWCNELVDIPVVQSLMGSAQYYRATTFPEIHVWAPYKQAVMFNITPTFTWFGDGTSILKKNFGIHRIEQSTDRAMKYGLSSKDLDRIVVGQRPYVKGEKGYFKQVDNNTWVSTGGAKNGTILAAYQAQQFLEAIS